MNSRSTIIAAALVAALGAAGMAAADGEVELRTSALQEVAVVAEDGRQVVELMPAAKVVPGTEVLYRIDARNRSQSPVDGVVIRDPIPEHMTYVPGSAEGEASTVSFSVDGGRTFAEASRLEVVGEDGAVRRAEARDYTDIEWVLRGPLDPSATRSVSFRARLD